MQWWPAKVLKVDENYIYAECFGDHCRDHYTFDKCILFADSEKDLEKRDKTPSVKKDDKMKQEFVRSFQVIKQLIYFRKNDRN